MRLIPPLLIAATFGSLSGTPTQAQEPKPAKKSDTERKMRELFEGGSIIPYRDLLRLLRGEGPTATTRPKPEKPPSGFVFLGASLSGVASDKVATFDATFDVEVLDGTGWVLIPIGLGEGALESATSGGKPATVGPMQHLAQRVFARRGVALPRTGFGILLKGKGRHAIKARFALPITTRPGASSVRLTLPRVALSKLELAVPDTGQEILIDNALASEQLGKQKGFAKARAYFGPGATARLTWNPRVKKARGTSKRADPLLFARTETALVLEEGALQATTRIEYRINRAPCDTFVVRYPAGYRLLDVSGAGRFTRSTSRAGQRRTLTVKLRQAVEERYVLTVKLERELDDAARKVAVPRIETVATQQESGLLAARASQYISLEPNDAKGLAQVDARSLPSRITSLLEWDASKARPPLAFRYQRQPYALTLHTSRIEPEVDGKVLTLAVVRDEDIALATTVAYTIRKKGIFGVQLRLPEGYTLLDFANEERIKDRRYSKDRRTLSVDFDRLIPHGKPFNLTFFGLVRRTAQPDHGKATLDLPRVGLVGVRKESGLLALGARNHLRLVLDERAGLWPVAVHELPGLGFPHGVRRGSEELIFGFRYGKPEGVRARFQAEKRDPKVQARTEMLVDAQEDQVRVEGKIHYRVEFAGVERVRIRVPAALGKDGAMHFARRGIREPSVAADGESAVWTVPLQGKRTGAFSIGFSYTIKLDDFSAGQQKEVTLHEVAPLDCFSETADIALKKHENLVLTERRMSLVEKRDKRELPEALKQQAGVIQAYRTLGHPYRLSLLVTKYDFKTPLGILIRHLHQEDVLGEDGRVQSEVTLALQSSGRQQDLRVVLPAGAKVRGLKIDGKSTTWETVPAAKDGPDAGRPQVRVLLGDVSQARRGDPFQVRIRFHAPGGKLGTAGGFDLPALRFPLGEGQVTVNRFTRAIFPPRGYAWLDFVSAGQQHFEQVSLWDRLTRWVHPASGRNRRRARNAARAANQAIARLKRMASGGHAGTYVPLDIPKDRQDYLFENQGAASALHVSYASWGLFYLLDLLVLLGVVGVGLWLDRRPKLPAGLGVFLEGEEPRLPPVVYPTLTAGLFVLGGLAFSAPYASFFASGFVGALGLGVFFLLRGLWLEATEVRSERRVEEHAVEAQVAMARAVAAEAEAKLSEQAEANRG